jgi:hypothetical protein
LAQPREIRPTRNGRGLELFFVTAGGGYQGLAFKQSWGTAGSGLVCRWIGAPSTVSAS